MLGLLDLRLTKTGDESVDVDRISGTNLDSSLFVQEDDQKVTWINVELLTQSALFKAADGQILKSEVVVGESCAGDWDYHGIVCRELKAMTFNQLQLPLEVGTAAVGREDHEHPGFAAHLGDFTGLLCCRDTNTN